MTNLSQMQKIIRFLEGKNLKAINNVIEAIEGEVKVDIAKIESLAEDLGLYIQVDDKGNYAKRIGAETGIYGINPSYATEFNQYTRKFSALFLLWYKVRDTISNYHSYKYAEIKGQNIKMSKIHYDNSPEKGIEVIKEFVNGKVIYKATEELLGRIEAVNWIHKYFGQPE